MRRGRRWKEHAHYPQLDCFLKDVSNKGLKCHIICPRFLFLSLPAMKQIWNPTRSQRESWHPHDCFAVDRPISTSSPEWMLFCCLGNRCVRPFRDTQIIMSYLWKISYMLILVLLLLLVSFIWSFQTCIPQNCEMMNFFCFKPSSSGYFVRASLGKEHNRHLRVVILCQAIY